MAKRTKYVEPEIPPDLMAMTLEELEELDENYCIRSERGRAERNRLLAIRNAAQAELVAFGNRRHDITRAILAKMETVEF